MIPNDSSIGKIFYLAASLLCNSRNQQMKRRSKRSQMQPTENLRNEAEKIQGGKGKKRRKEEGR
jgi:hypothetical protein